MSTPRAARLWHWLFGTTETPYSIFMRISVGLIFFTQGILKYTDPNMGVLRFTHIGFPVPDFLAHFVGTFEIVCGLLVLCGLGVRAGAIPLLIINLVAVSVHLPLQETQRRACPKGRVTVYQRHG